MNTAIRSKGLLGVSKSIWNDPRTWLFLLAITEKSLFRYVLLILDIVTGIEAIREIVIHITYITVIILCINKGSRLRGADIFILLSVIFAIIFTWLIYPDNIEKYMFGEKQFWATVVPLFRFFIVGLFIIPKEETLDLMGKVSCIAVLVETFFVMYFLRESDLQNQDDMSRAYFMLLNVLLVINYAFDRRTLIGIAISIVGMMLLLSMGTRGPIIIVLAFIACKIFQTSTSKGKGGIVVAVLLVLIWFVNSPYWDLALLYLQSVLGSLGMSTRVIDFAIQGETLTYYSERDEIAQLVISKIKERPIEGWGVYGEWQFVGWSAHNMYLEILDHYGVILGGFIILWIFIINIKAFFTTSAIPVRGLVLLFACYVLVRGIYGGGFLTFPTFLMIGYCLQVCRKTNLKYI